MEILDEKSIYEEMSWEYLRYKDMLLYESRRIRKDNLIEKLSPSDFWQYINLNEWELTELERRMQEKIDEDGILGGDPDEDFIDLSLDEPPRIMI